jgi:hypothetical protein
MLRVKGPELLDLDISSDPPGSAPFSASLNESSNVSDSTPEQREPAREQKAGHGLTGKGFQPSVDRKKGLPKMQKDNDYAPVSWAPTVGVRRGS